MHAPFRDHRTALPLLAATDPLGPIHDLFPVHPETTPRRPQLPDRRRRDRRQPPPEQHRKPSEDEQPHVDDYA